MQQVRAYIGLGGNVGDAQRTLEAAVAALARLPGVRLRDVSRLYVTTPVGVVDQPDFHNAAVAIDVPAGPDDATGATDLLAALKGLERAFGRRTRRRWGPREVDLDLLVFGPARLDIVRRPGTESADPAKAGTPLVVPHPEAARRLFVLAPLADVAPDLVPPGWDDTVAAVRDARLVAEGPGAARPVGRWDPAARAWRTTGEGPATHRAEA